MASEVLTNSSSPAEQTFPLSLIPGCQENAPASEPRLPLLHTLEESGQGLPIIPSASSAENHGSSTASLNRHEFSLFDCAETALYHQNVEKLKELKEAIACKQSVYFWINIAQIAAVVAGAILGIFLGPVAAIPFGIAMLGLWAGNLKVECQIAEIQHELHTLQESHRIVEQHHGQNQMGLQLVKRTQNKLLDCSDLFPSTNPQMEALDLPANGCTLARRQLHCYNVYGAAQNEAGKAHLLREKEKLNQMFAHTFPRQTEPVEASH